MREKIQIPNDSRVIAKLREDSEFKTIQFTFQRQMREINASISEKSAYVKEQTQLFLNYNYPMIQKDLGDLQKQFSRFQLNIQSSYQDVEKNIKAEENRLKKSESMISNLLNQETMVQKKVFDIENQIKQLELNKGKLNQKAQDLKRQNLEKSLELEKKKQSELEIKREKEEDGLDKSKREFPIFKEKLYKLFYQRFDELVIEFTQSLKVFRNKIEAGLEEIIGKRVSQKSASPKAKVPASILFDKIVDLEIKIQAKREKISETYMSLENIMTQTIKKSIQQKKPELMAFLIDQDMDQNILAIKEKALAEEELQLMRSKFEELAITLFYVVTPLEEQGQTVLDASENEIIKQIYEKYSQIYFHLIQTYPYVIRIHESNQKYFDDKKITPQQLFEYAKEMKWYYTFPIAVEDYELQYYRHIIERNLFALSNADFRIPRFRDAMEEENVSEEAEEEMKGWIMIPKIIEDQKTTQLNLDQMMNLQLPPDSPETMQRYYKLMYKDYPNAKFIKELEVQETKLRSICKMGGQISDDLLDDAIGMITKKMIGDQLAHKAHLIKVITWRLTHLIEPCYCNKHCAEKTTLNTDADLQEYIKARITRTDEYSVAELKTLIKQILTEYGLNSEKLSKYIGKYIHVFGYFYLLIKKNVIYLQSIREKNVVNYEYWYFS